MRSGIDLLEIAFFWAENSRRIQVQEEYENTKRFHVYCDGLISERPISAGSEFTENARLRHESCSNWPPTSSGSRLILNQRPNIISLQFLSPGKEFKFDHENQSLDLSAETLNQIAHCFRRATCR